MASVHEISMIFISRASSGTNALRKMNDFHHATCTAKLAGFTAPLLMPGGAFSSIVSNMDRCWSVPVASTDGCHGSFHFSAGTLCIVMLLLSGALGAGGALSSMRC